MTRAAILEPLRDWPTPVEAKSGFYTVEGRRFARVTSVERMMGLGTEALCAWNEKQGKAAALEAVRANYEWLRGMDVDGFIAAIEPEVARAKKAMAVMNKAADIGTLAHRMVENWLLVRAGKPEKWQGLVETPESRWAAMAYEDWFTASGYKTVLTEQFVYDEEMGVAGTIDHIVEAPDGCLEVHDLKSSNYILPNHHVQVATYLHMARQWRPIARAKIVRIPKEYGTVAVEVRELGEVFNMSKKQHETKTPEQLLEAFRGALAIYRVFVGGEA